MIRNTSIETAATPAGVGFVPFRFRGCRSCLAQPPANGWHPSGMATPARRAAWIEPGGFKAISRWLSVATPPGHDDGHVRIPEGCQRGSRLPARVDVGGDGTWLRSLRDRFIRGRGFRGCRSYLAQPPANGWHPSRMATPARLAAGVEPGGFKAISRWLSAATPPVRGQNGFCIPEGCQHATEMEIGCANAHLKNMGAVWN